MHTALSFKALSLYGKPYRKAIHLAAENWPGCTLCLFITICAYLLSQTPMLFSAGVSPILLAMLGGILLGNLARPDFFRSYDKGIGFSKQKLLRLGIILFGFKLTFTDIGSVGISGIAIDAGVLLSTLFISWIAGRRIFKLDGSACMLIGSGSAICGAAAILATEPVVKAKPEEVSMAIACIVLFGTCATLLYPFLYALNEQWQVLPPTHHAFGIYIGSTIHEVAQVAATAHMIDQNVAGTAIIEKMARVMMLPLFLIALQTVYVNRGAYVPHWNYDDHSRIIRFALAAKQSIPWFAIGFCIVIAMNTLATISDPMREWFSNCSTLLLAMAMAALGLGTRFSAFNRHSLKMFGLASLLFLWLVVGGGGINYLLQVHAT